MRGYYAILDATPEMLDLGASAALQAHAGKLLAARPCCLQLRAKAATARALEAGARVLLPLCRAAGVPFCVNDRLDVALAVGGDVRHPGQEDLAPREVSRTLGP